MDIRAFLYVYFLYGGLILLAGLFYLINFLLFLMPVGFAGSLAGFAYYKDADESKERLSLAKHGIIICLIGSILSFILGMGMFW